MARRRADKTRLHELEALRAERFALMAQLEQLPDDIVFFTQITMEAAEDTEFLDAMKRAHIRGALVGVEAVTKAGLKDVYKGFNLYGDELIARLQTFRRHGDPRARVVHLRAAQRREGHLRTRRSRWRRKPTSPSRSSCC